MNTLLFVAIIAVVLSFGSSFSISKLIKNTNKLATAAIISGVIGSSSAPAFAEIVFQQPVKKVALLDIPIFSTPVALPTDNNYVLNFDQDPNFHAGVSTLFVPKGSVDSIPKVGTDKFSVDVKADEVDLAFGAPPDNVIYFKVPADFSTGTKKLTTFKLNYDGVGQVLKISKKN